MYTANLCLYNIISFMYNNDTYGIDTIYIIDYKNKIINRLNLLSIELVNVQECNWYFIKSVKNTGIITGTIYIQGPNYNISKISSIENILSTEYPVTETIVGITIGLIIPLILISFIIFFMIYKVDKSNKTKEVVNIKQQKEEEIINKIRNHYLIVPSYDTSYDEKLKLNFKKELYDLYSNHHDFIDKTINKYENLDIGSDNICIKCKKEKVKLYKNKFGLNECEICSI